ncbi:uncharacterized protein LOC124371926, partial [Homalodisca vitripennis]|uniref:uncharacterized protein LOC124371926 n=1 Tax=Homalodisca vitripennis TaxID=197043 RepID=UPI001EEBB77D
MSGGSDNNSDSFDDFVTDDFNLSHASNTSSVKCEWSCSGGCSEVSDRGVAERLAGILARGARLIKTEVWTWGSVQHGQLGTGDMVKRHRPVLVNQLLHGGVDRIVCGDSHCLAITLTGMCYAWGANDSGQVSAVQRGTDLSCPVAWGHVVRAAAGTRHSVLIASDHTLHWLGKHRNEDMAEYDMLDSEIPLHVMCCGDFTCIVAGSLDSDVASSTDLASEQCFLEEMLTVQTSVLKPLARKSNLDDIIANLCSKYTDLLQLTAVNVTSMSQGTSSFKLLQDHMDEYLQVYDVIFGRARVVDIPPRLVAIFSDRLPSRKTSPEAILTCAFTHPLNRVSVYKMMLSRGQSPVPPEALKWEQFCDKQDTMRKPGRQHQECSGRVVADLWISSGVQNTLDLWRSDGFGVEIFRLATGSESKLQNLRFDNVSGDDRELRKSQDKIFDLPIFLSDVQQAHQGGYAKMWYMSEKEKSKNNKFFCNNCQTPICKEHTVAAMHKMFRVKQKKPIMKNVSRFSSQWLILLSDALVYICGATQTVYNLDTLWVETKPDNDTIQ